VTDLNRAQLCEGTVEDRVARLAGQPRRIHESIDVRMLVIDRPSQRLPCSLISRAYGVGGSTDFNAARSSQIEKIHWLIRTSDHSDPAAGGDLAGEDRAMCHLYELIANDGFQKGCLERGSYI